MFFRKFLSVNVKFIFLFFIGCHSCENIEQKLVFTSCNTYILSYTKNLPPPAAISIFNFSFCFFIIFYDLTLKMKCSVCSLTEEPDMGSVLVYLEKIKTICICKFCLFFFIHKKNILIPFLNSQLFPRKWNYKIAN